MYGDKKAQKGFNKFYEFLAPILYLSFSLYFFIVIIISTVSRYQKGVTFKKF